jgi:Putative adhesin
MRSETFFTPGDVRLNLELPAGKIEIESAETDDTQVELEAVSSNEQVREMVETARIEEVRRGDGHEVIVEVRTRHGVWISFSRGPDLRIGAPEMRLRVRCPKGAELDVRTKSADVEARGEYGRSDVKTASGDVSVEQAVGADVKTASGDVHVERVDGTLDVKSASGDVAVGMVGGPATIQLVSGDLWVREANESLSANTVSGDQRIEAVGQGRVELKAISGDISVGVRRGTRLFVDANTVSGSTSSEVELGDSPAADGPSEGPLVEVFAKTVSGDVRIERAPAAREQTGLSEQA